MYEIIPAILAQDLQSYKHQLNLVEDLVERVHVDIMDGKFVPNTTLTLKETFGISTQLKKSVHLMVSDPIKHISDLDSNDFDEVIAHYESFLDQEQLINAIQNAIDQKVKFTLAINPNTSEDVLLKFKDKINSVLMMTVEPGYSGQQNLGFVIEKIIRTKKMLPDFDFAVDGGINANNISFYFDAGIRKFAMASAIFKGEPKDNIANLKNILTKLETNFNSK